MTYRLSSANDYSLLFKEISFISLSTENYYSSAATAT